MKFESFFFMIFKLAIIYGIFREQFNNTALIIAENKNNTEIIRLLLAHKNINVNIQNIIKQNNFFLMFKSPFFHMIENFIYLWNFKQIFNQTALINAAETGHSRNVRLLLTNNDVDINIQNILNLHFFLSYLKLAF